jgi:glutamine cyclotransferase
VALRVGLEPELLVLAVTAREVRAGPTIAYRAETDTFLLTGKMWPHIYEVKLVPAPPITEEPTSS